MGSGELSRTMAASTTLSLILLSAFLDVNTCMQAAIAIVKNTDCNPQVSCSSDRTIYLASCSTTNFDLLGFNATYYLDYQYNINYVAQGLSIYYSSTQLLWTFATSDALLDFYSAAIYNSTCNTNVDKASLSIVMTTPSNNNFCTFTTSTLLPFDSFKSGPASVSNSASDADAKFASAL